MAKNKSLADFLRRRRAGHEPQRAPHITTSAGLSAQAPQVAQNPASNSGAVVSSTPNTDTADLSIADDSSALRQGVEDGVTEWQSLVNAVPTAASASISNVPTPIWGSAKEPKKEVFELDEVIASVLAEKQAKLSDDMPPTTPDTVPPEAFEPAVAEDAPAVTVDDAADPTSASNNDFSHFDTLSAAFAADSTPQSAESSIVAQPTGVHEVTAHIPTNETAFAAVTAEDILNTAATLEATTANDNPAVTVDDTTETVLDASEAVSDAEPTAEIGGELPVDSAGQTAEAIPVQTTDTAESLEITAPTAEIENELPIDGAEQTTEAVPVQTTDATESFEITTHTAEIENELPVDSAGQTTEAVPAQPTDAEEDAAAKEEPPVAMRSTTARRITSPSAAVLVHARRSEKDAKVKAAEAEIVRQLDEVRAASLAAEAARAERDAAIMRAAQEKFSRAFDEIHAAEVEVVRAAEAARTEVNAQITPDTGFPVAAFAVELPDPVVPASPIKEASAPSVTNDAAVLNALAREAARRKATMENTTPDTTAAETIVPDDTSAELSAAEAAAVFDAETSQEVAVLPFDKKDYRTLSVLLNASKDAAGKPPLSQLEWAALHAAIDNDKIFFYLATQNGHTVGCCSVCVRFSSLRCKPSGILEDFYIAPLPRDEYMAAAQALANTAYEIVSNQGGNTLQVCCDENMRPLFRALGFVRDGNLSMLREQ